MICGLLSVNPLLKLKENIKIGMPVRVARRVGTKEGIVTDIIDESFANEKGIEVEIDHYCTGNAIEDLSSPEELSVKEIMDLIEKHETATFELKSSFKYHLKLSQRLKKPVESPELKRKIVEEVVSFMNCEGGTICIGVDNHKNIVGLENDYKLLSIYEEGERDEELLADKLGLEIQEEINKYIDDDLAFTLSHTQMIPNFDNTGKTICLVVVKKSSRPMFIKFKNVPCRIDKKDTTVDFWNCFIRNDKGIREINFEAFLDYWMDRDRDHS